MALSSQQSSGVLPTSPLSPCKCSDRFMSFFGRLLGTGRLVQSWQQTRGKKTVECWSMNYVKLTNGRNVAETSVEMWCLFFRSSNKTWHFHVCHADRNIGLCPSTSSRLHLGFADVNETKSRFMIPNSGTRVFRVPFTFHVKWYREKELCLYTSVQIYSFYCNGRMVFVIVRTSPDSACSIMFRCQISTEVPNKGLQGSTLEYSRSPHWNQFSLSRQITRDLGRILHIWTNPKPNNFIL